MMGVSPTSRFAETSRRLRRRSLPIRLRDFAGLYIGRESAKSGAMDLFNEFVIFGNEVSDFAARCPRSLETLREAAKSAKSGRVSQARARLTPAARSRDPWSE